MKVYLKSKIHVFTRIFTRDRFSSYRRIPTYKVNGANAKKLWDLYDKIQSNVRALETVGIHQEQIGPLLIPIAQENLPNVIKLQISRKLGKENWGTDNFLRCINTEITARESYEFMKQDVNEGTPNKSSFSRGVLFKQ